MIDFIKARLPYGSFERLEKHDLLDFQRTVSDKTGEVKAKRIAKYFNMEFIFYSDNYFILQGSLHKLKNKGKHNFDLFTFQELLKVLNHLEQTFEIDLKTAKILNLEFGINVSPPIPTKKILDNLLLHRNKEFKNVAVWFGNYRQVAKQRFIVKAYDKGKQHKRKDQIFRFEIKQQKMIDLSILGISSLADLRNKNTLILLKERLLQEWDKVLLFDPTIKKEGLNKRIQEVKLLQWENPRYWLQLTKQEKSRQKQQYKEICFNNSRQIHRQIQKRIKTTWEQSLKN